MLKKKKFPYFNIKLDSDIGEILKGLLNKWDRFLDTASLQKQ
jgi:hypothetical protein